MRGGDRDGQRRRPTKTVAIGISFEGRANSGESGYIAAAMPAADKSHPLSKAEARRIWLRAQRLDSSAPFGAGPGATAAAVEHLGYVQIDTINVIERSHHHILWTRIPEYRRADLRRAQSVDKSVFEYWTHALSYVPTRDLRFFIPAMKRHRREGHKWLSSVSPADLRKVMRLIRRDGALTIRDIDDDVLVDKEHLWASRKPSKRALQLAFYTGVLTISERNGMLKTYELMARHFGWDQPPNKPPKPASAKEVTAYLLDRALRAQGLVSLDSICHLDAPSKTAIRRLVEARVRAKALVPVALEGAGKQEHWARPGTLETAGEGAFELVHILSPFDPLIIQRKRTELFFGYGHRFEAYVPKEKRLFGYFALPVLVGDDIVAAIDLKTDRKSRKLLMQKWSWVGKGAQRGARKDLKRRIEEELHRFERFQLASEAVTAEPADVALVSPG
ncbi:MAG: cytoplasmic protein [Bradyrhizobium sp.]|nr:cytoplasmic protein [Bradyrhizobium sp.]MEA2867694.1 uncharacterized protein [Bradyrhizobium sp.]